MAQEPAVALAGASMLLYLPLLGMHWSPGIGSLAPESAATSHQPAMALSAIAP